ncbi:hypothetical protein HAZT_HAZT000693 [Hyalella azteca]|uniref:ARID domain-containing protein n=1 Tax=Hyalella azteca TaxID=294128 RepID=A0A6A0H6A2_HYAAZ|nr:hypothetical protein HAZT_HAZT000693 [Hyalella azteca]
MVSNVIYNLQAEDPPFLSVGTEVSAKYKGAFCEAKVHKVEKCVKIKVTYKGGLGSHVVSDEQVKGLLKVGSSVKAMHPDRANHQDATIAKIQDCSQYTVGSLMVMETHVFDDGDITTLRRTSLCLKSGRHFAESESLDQLPLTHPEHFGSPVVGGGGLGRRGVARRHKSGGGRHNTSGGSGSDSSASSGEEEDVHKTHCARREEWEQDISKVVCVEACDNKKKQRDNWFPGLVVAPTAQDTVRIDTRKDFLVRSFQDGRYYTVPKKEATTFTKEIGAKVTLGSLKAAVDKAMEYLNTDVLPPHWDRDVLFGMDISEQDTDGTESDESDDEPREEKDHFVAQLYKFMEDCGTPINKGPTIANRDLDLYRLFKIVQKLGGFNRVLNQNQLKVVAHKMNLSSLGSQGPNLIKSAYKRYLHSFEDFYRKLGCTMVSSPRRMAPSRPRSGGRSLIRDCDRVDKSPHSVHGLGANSPARSGSASASPTRSAAGAASGEVQPSQPSQPQPSSIAGTIIRGGNGTPRSGVKGRPPSRRGALRDTSKKSGGGGGDDDDDGDDEEEEDDEPETVSTTPKDIRTYSRITRQEAGRAPDVAANTAAGTPPSSVASTAGLTAAAASKQRGQKDALFYSPARSSVAKLGRGTPGRSETPTDSRAVAAVGTSVTTKPDAAKDLQDAASSEMRTRSSARGESDTGKEGRAKGDEPDSEDDEECNETELDSKTRRSRASRQREGSRELSAPPSSPSVGNLRKSVVVSSSNSRKKLTASSLGTSLDLDNDSDSQDNESCHSSASGGGSFGENGSGKRRGGGACRGSGRTRGGASSTKGSNGSARSADESDKAKKGRKKRLEANILMDAEVQGESKTGIPSSVPVNVGDKLLVLYGPNSKQSKVTYVAKVSSSKV